jgi:CheY-like chemotaxis protein
MLCHETVLVILVIDDNRQLRETLTEFLYLHGHDVRCAADGAEAMQVLARLENPPAIILLDVMMPVLDGWDFLAALRQKPVLAHIPVVIVSACDYIAERAKEAGAVAILRKPVRPQMLLRVIERFAGGPSGAPSREPFPAAADGLSSVEVDATTRSKVLSFRHRSPSRLR